MENFHNMIELSSGVIECVGSMKNKREVRFFLYNPNERDLTFKLKSTSQDEIKLQPGFGYIKAKSRVNVIMTVYPMKERARIPQHEHVTVLVADVQANRPKNATRLWTNAEKPDNVCRYRFRIGFVTDREEHTVTSKENQRSSDGFSSGTDCSSSYKNSSSAGRENENSDIAEEATGD